MCGLAGALDLGGGPAPDELVATMTRVLAHRGPDGDGQWSDGPVAFGHRRLAILDRSAAGAQPMVSDDGALCIITNGEVYNYIELRDELRGLGHRFVTGTDTEVILHAYAQWGTRCLARFNGMFAFALWDAPRRRLVCARDRVGVKPFYYARAGQTFLFASEATSLLLTGLVDGRPRESAVHRFLAAGYHPAGRDTFFSGIRQLRPGHLLIVEGKRVEEQQWWRLPEHTEYLPLSEEAAASRFRDLFEDAVRLRLRSDVPVGSCLSGGLDSSAIVCTAAALQGGDIEHHTFSAVFDEPEIAEGRYVREVARHTGVQSHTVRPRWDELAADLPRLVRHQEAPFISTSVFAQWKVMELARRTGVPVLLDGQGADELLAGYPGYGDDYLSDLARAGQSTRLLAEARAIAGARGDPLPRVLARAALKRAPAVWRPARLIDPEFAASFPPTAVEPGGYPDRLTARLAFDVTSGNLPALLHYEDRNSMAFSVEARLPFLDYRLVEFAFALGPRHKLGHGTTKRVLRTAMRGIVPEAVRTRRDKIGFATPEAAWLTGPGRNWVRSIISSPEFQSRPYFNAGAFTSLPLEPGAPEVRDSLVWRCISLELWLRAFVDRPPAAIA